MSHLLFAPALSKKKLNLFFDRAFLLDAVFFVLDLKILHELVSVRAYTPKGGSLLHVNEDMKSLCIGPADFMRQNRLP